MISLLRYFRSIYPLPEALRDNLEDIVKEKKLAKKDYLLKTGQVCGNIYFVEEGLLRGYYVKASKEISSSFMKEGDICIAAESFLTQQRSQESIQALEDSTVSYISYDELQRIYRDFEGFNRIGRIMVEQCYVQYIQRFSAMWMQRSEERYDWLIRRSPDLLQRIPAKYLASYLGITESMLSVIKTRR
jgi:CRP-like cAMP-binding protein